MHRKDKLKEECIERMSLLKGRVGTESISLLNGRVGTERMSLLNGRVGTERMSLLYSMEEFIERIS